MERNEMLEELSEKVRKGEPIGFLDAIVVIEYQAARRETLAAEKKANSWWNRLKRYLKR